MNFFTENKSINALLIFLVLLDLWLSATCLFFPEKWTELMHGVAYTDSLGIIRRLGAVWLAFFIFQLIALLKWQKQNWWLVLIAGIRLTEIFSDWFYWYFAEQLTAFGHFGLLIAPPSNIFFGIIFIRMYLKSTNNVN